MEPKNIIHASNRDELRQWYTAIHGTCQEMWLRVNRWKAPAEVDIDVLVTIIQRRLYNFLKFELSRSFMLLNMYVQNT